MPSSGRPQSSQANPGCTSTLLGFLRILVIPVSRIIPGRADTVVVSFIPTPKTGLAGERRRNPLRYMSLPRSSFVIYSIDPHGWIVRGTCSVPGKDSSTAQTTTDEDSNTKQWLRGSRVLAFHFENIMRRNIFNYVSWIGTFQKGLKGGR